MNPLIEGRRADGTAVYVTPTSMNYSEAADLSSGDVVSIDGHSYTVSEVIRWGPVEVELVTYPRLPIGTEFFSASSLVHIIG